jgi:cyclophilin family peptidyl-prolyl cis-trans isomerase
MNKTTMGLVLVGILFLGGFLYLRSRPVPEPEVTETAVETVQDVSDTSQVAGLQDININMADVKQYPGPPEMTINTAKQYLAEIKTSKGKIALELYADEVPITVNNFVFLVNEGFYDGTVFHRIIKEFMIQGGDPLGNGTGGPGYQFPDEPITRDYNRGVVAMANAGPNTNGSQFFIMHQDNPQLPKDYVIFGKLADEESLITLDAIAEIPVTVSSMGEPSAPTERVMVNSIQIISE